MNLYKIENLIERRMAEHQIPGAALSIVQDESIIYARGFGISRQDAYRLPVTPETLFRVGALSKMLTTTVMMQLFEEGAISLDEPIITYLPWLQLSNSDYIELMTLRRLLTHTTGLPNDHSPFKSRNPEGLERYVREILPTYRFIAPPNTLFSYSSPGYRLVGAVMEAVTGEWYTDLMAHKLFAPLQMSATTFDPSVALTYPFAQAHQPHKDGGLSVSHYAIDNTTAYPSEGAMSSVLDLANFMIMFLNKGIYRWRQILTEKSIQMMTKPLADVYGAADGHYGLGMMVERLGNQMTLLSQQGQIASFGVKTLMVPEARFGMVMVNNYAYPFWNAMDEIMDAVLRPVLSLPKQPQMPKKIMPDLAEWENYVGFYLGYERGVASIQMADDRLILDWNGEEIILYAVRDDLYYGEKIGHSDLIWVGFVEGDGTNRLGHDYIVLNGSPCQRSERYAPFSLPDDALKIYEGAYSNESEQMVLRVQDDDLYLYSVQRDQRVRCLPLEEHRFACDVGILDFQLDDSGEVRGVMLANTHFLPKVNS